MIAETDAAAAAVASVGAPESLLTFLQ